MPPSCLRFSLGWIAPPAPLAPLDLNGGSLPESATLLPQIALRHDEWRRLRSLVRNTVSMCLASMALSLFLSGKRRLAHNAAASPLPMGWIQQASGHVTGQTTKLAERHDASPVFGWLRHCRLDLARQWRASGEIRRTAVKRCHARWWPAARTDQSLRLRIDGLPLGLTRSGASRSSSPAMPTSVNSA